MFKMKQNFKKFHVRLCYFYCKQGDYRKKNHASRSLETEIESGCTDFCSETIPTALKRKLTD